MGKNLPQRIIFSNAAPVLNLASVPNHSADKSKYGKLIHADGNKEYINKENLLSWLTKIIQDRDIQTLYNVYDYDDNLQCNECINELEPREDFDSEAAYQCALVEYEKNKPCRERDNNVLSEVSKKAQSLSQCFKYNFFILSRANKAWLSRIPNMIFSEKITCYYGKDENGIIDLQKCKPNTVHLYNATVHFFGKNIDKAQDFVLMTGDNIRCDVGLVANCLLEGIASLAILNTSHINKKYSDSEGEEQLKTCLSDNYFAKLKTDKVKLSYIPPVALTKNMAQLRELQCLIITTLDKIKKDNLH